MESNSRIISLSIAAYRIAGNIAVANYMRPYFKSLLMQSDIVGLAGSGDI